MRMERWRAAPSAREVSGMIQLPIVAETSPRAGQRLLQSCSTSSSRFPPSTISVNGTRMAIANALPVNVRLPCTIRGIVRCCPRRRPSLASNTLSRSTSTAAPAARLASLRAIRSTAWTKTKRGETSACLIGGSRAAPVMQHVTAACHHCLQPACMIACPVNAYEKDPITGIVKHLDDQCFGCQYCTIGLPV